MRVCWLVRPNLNSQPGGDTTQIHQTAAALQARGVTIDLHPGREPPHRGYDLVHLFHLDRLWEHVTTCAALRRRRLPSVLSTIYWPADEFDRHARRGWQGALARRFGSPTYRTLRLWQRALLDAMQHRTLPPLSPRLRSFRTAARNLLNTVNALLPNSQAEADILAHHLGPLPPAYPVPNAADAAIFGLPAAGPPRSGVLCVGRLEPRKNQHQLITACKQLDLPLTLVGNAGRFSHAYAKECHDRARGADVTFLPRQPATSLRDHYQQAAIHACVSWYETPGLASLEAALCGCALVVTPGGCTREYFRDQAAYASPHDASTIQTALRQALTEHHQPALAQRVAAEFTWSAAAQATLAAYDAVLAKTSATTAST